MNQEKIKSDIIILEDLLLLEEREIIYIDNQLEVEELNTDGSDDYFQWRTNAITARNYKRAKKNAIKRQLNFWKGIFSGVTDETKAQLKVAAINRLVAIENKNKENRDVKSDKRKTHLEQMTLIKDLKKAKEIEKTKRHKASEIKNLKIAGFLKK